MQVIIYINAKHNKIRQLLTDGVPTTLLKNILYDISDVRNSNKMDLYVIYSGSKKTNKYVYIGKMRDIDVTITKRHVESLTEEDLDQNIVFVSNSKQKWGVFEHVRRYHPLAKCVIKYIKNKTPKIYITDRYYQKLINSSIVLDDQIITQDNVIRSSLNHPKILFVELHKIKIGNRVFLSINKIIVNGIKHYKTMAHLSLYIRSGYQTDYIFFEKNGGSRFMGGKIPPSFM